jgi:hypothetical protein
MMNLEADFRAHYNTALEQAAKQALELAETRIVDGYELHKVREGLERSLCTVFSSPFTFIAATMAARVIRGGTTTEWKAALFELLSRSAVVYCADEDVAYVQAEAKRLLGPKATEVAREGHYCLVASP